MVDSPNPSVVVVSPLKDAHMGELSASTDAPISPPPALLSGSTSSSETDRTTTEASETTTETSEGPTFVPAYDDADYQ
eukprot:14092264-Alexandrium_andersonii.AAC.1